MAASQSQEPFYDYLKKLNYNEKEKTIFYLMDIFLENIKELEKYDLINYIKEIDYNEYNSFFNKENYKSDWRYTIKLLNLLLFCESGKYNSYFNDIMENSKSEKIKNILLINKNIFSGNINEIDF